MLSSKILRLCSAMGSVVGISMFACQAVMAQPVAFLNDDNSDATVDANGLGQTAWVVDGVPHLSQQWFWYRFGDNTTIGPATVFDATILTSFFVSSADPDDPDDDRVIVKYTVPGMFTFKLTFDLLGGPAFSGVSDIAESLEIINISGATLKLQFFQYANLDLGGDPDDDSVIISGGNTATQFDGSAKASEVVSDIMPSRYEADTIDGIDDTLAKLTDPGFTVFDNVAAAAGDVTWGFQWNFSLTASGPGHAVLFSKDKNIQIPAPGAALLAALGMGVLGAWKRRRAA